MWSDKAFLSSSVVYLVSLSGKVKVKMMRSTTSKVKMLPCRTRENGLRANKVGATMLDVQVMLNTSKYYLIEDICKFTAGYLNMEVSELLTYIEVKEGLDGGFVATLAPSVILSVGGTAVPFRNVSEMKDHLRCPPFGLKHRAQRKCWNDFESAFAALLLHILLSLRKRIGTHWSVPLMQNCFELVVLLPTDLVNEPGKTRAIFTLHRSGHEIFGRFIDPGKGNLLESFAVSKFEHSFFMDKKGKIGESLN
jgi:hypothetical protein